MNLNLDLSKADVDTLYYALHCGHQQLLHDLHDPETPEQERTMLFIEQHLFTKLRQKFAIALQTARDKETS